MSKYAIIESGSKQYRVEPNGVFEVEKLAVTDDADKEVSLDRVLLVSDGKNIQIGTPCVEGAKVVCDRVGEVKGKKVIAFKFRRRKSSQRKIGHRQKYTQLRVKDIISS